MEVEGDKGFIEKQLKRFEQRFGAGVSAPARYDSSPKLHPTSKPSRGQTPAEYYREKRPEGGTATLLVLAKYLDEQRNKSEFTREDINKVAGEAKIKSLHGEYYRLAAKQGLLRTIGKGKYGLTISGEDVVAAMPSKQKP